MKKILTTILMAGIFAACSQEKEPMPWEGKIDEGGQEQEEGEQGLPAGYATGKKLPGWTEGVFDIHAINSGRGECSFIIMPDGTTAVIDAGEVGSSSSYNSVPARPSGSMRAYKVYADYIKAYKSGTAIDYFILTHYHTDHFGQNDKSYAKDSKGGYTITGMTGLYNEVPFNTLIDRAYPKTDQESIKAEIPSDTPDMSFYNDFVNYQTKQGLKVQKAEVGSSTQVKMLGKNASKYPNFKVQCVGGDGYGWNGSEAVDFRTSAENGRSLCYLFSYGKFDYFTSGDMNVTAECKAIAQGIGRKIEAMKCHHHMSNTGSYDAENALYNPKVIVTQSFYVRPNQPHQEIISNCGVNQHMFFTNINFELASKEGATVGGTKNLPLEKSKYTNVTDYNGHVVIRYFPDKEQFYVFMLDDSDQMFKIRAIYGPYSCY